MTEDQKICRKCASPLTPGMKFCESCGTKIETLSSCPECGASVNPAAKFCESCGRSADAAGSAPEKIPASEPPVILKEKAPAETKPATENAGGEPEKTRENVAPAPEERTKAPVRTEKVIGVAKETGGQKGPAPGMTMIIAGVIALILVGVAVYFVVLPMLSGSGAPAQNQPVLPVPTSSGSSSGTPSTPTTLAGTVSLTAGPTQVPPVNRVIILDAERDPISSKVTVTFRGGTGQNGVREIQVTLTRSDGTLETKAFKPEAIGSGVTLQGTAKTDRIEATTYFYTGEQYKILDRIFEYKKRGG